MARTSNVAGTSTDTSTDTEDVKKYNIAASVSQQFQDAVRKAAKDAQFTVSTWLSYHLMQALGMSPELPDKDADSENITISTAVPENIRDAIRNTVKEADKSQADFIREVAAQACGYDLSQEPERLPAGEALKKYKDQVQNKDQVLLDLWEDDPDMLARMLVRRGKTWSDIGLKDAQVQAALKAGTLSQDNYDAVTAATASNGKA